MSQKLSGLSRCCWPGVATTAGPATPARANNSARAWGVVISSQGLNALTSDGSTEPTDSQKQLLAGSNRPGPQVVIASTPPGRTSRHISAVNVAISGAKKTPKTHTTASKLPPASPVQIASP